MEGKNVKNKKTANDITCADDDSSPFFRVRAGAGKSCDLFNQYGVIVVDPSKNDQINGDGALAFQEWILSNETQGLISEYGVEEYGKALFTPNASK